MCCRARVEATRKGTRRSPRTCSGYSRRCTVATQCCVHTASGQGSRFSSAQRSRTISWERPARVAESLDHRCVFSRRLYRCPCPRHLRARLRPQRNPRRVRQRVVKLITLRCERSQSVQLQKWVAPAVRKHLHPLVGRGAAIGINVLPSWRCCRARRCASGVSGGGLIDKAGRCDVCTTCEQIRAENCGRGRRL